MDDLDRKVRIKFTVSDEQNTNMTTFLKELKYLFAVQPVTCHILAKTSPPTILRLTSPLN